jgi:hypothetical protein
VGLVFVIAALTSYRLTRLIARDEFPPLAVQRERIAVKWPGDSWQVYLSRCSWCVGVYVSGVVILFTWLILAVAGNASMPAPLLWWGGAAAVVGIIAELIEALAAATEKLGGD